MRNFLTGFLAILFTGIFLYSCKKDNGGATPGNSRNIKYEITGNFTGKLDVLYSNNANGNTAVTDVVLPWSKEILYGSNVITIGIGAQGKTAGTPGQTATIKIYSNGIVVKTSTATAGALGEIVLPTIAYGF
ncbi:MAG TPA: MmpS family transport accessory protein [Sediminibacterium sp.]|nr:MmpS family transport accessory protein [Sediminibacterium sp.]